MQRFVVAAHVNGLFFDRCAQSFCQLHDADIITLSDLNRSAITELQVFRDHIETADEAAAVKPLHDRVHVLVVQLRVLRNTLEAMENAAEKAIEDVRRISASVEESNPDDDAL